MGFTVAHTLVLIVAAASMFTVSMASRGWSYGFNYTNWGRPKNDSHHHHKPNVSSNKVTVGGSNWHFGFNYSVWAFQNAPFYVNDVLIFKYDLPDPPKVFPHSVYMLPDIWSYLTCDLSRAKMIANNTQGSGKGFQFVLNKWQPYYFACGERDGFHCREGGMKFMVMPVLNRWRY